MQGGQRGHGDEDGDDMMVVDSGTAATTATATASASATALETGEAFVAGPRGGDERSRVHAINVMKLIFQVCLYSNNVMFTWP